jgi:hypothetical protein
VNICGPQAQTEANLPVEFSKIRGPLYCDWEMPEGLIEDGLEGRALEDHIERLLKEQNGTV